MSGKVGDMLKNTNKKQAGKEIDSMEEIPSKRELKPLPKSIVTIRDDDWKSLQASITYLFHKKKLPKLELDVLNEKVRNVRDSEIGAFIVEYYKDSILKKGMIVLRENIKEKKGNDLLERLSDVWCQFYTSILPTLLAIFYPIQEQGINMRSVTLVGFRDIVLLKTKIHEALETGEKVSGEIRQMLLVLASVHESNPPSDNYMQLERLVARVVRPYLGFDGLYTKLSSPMFRRISSDPKVTNGNVKERKLSRSQIIKEEMSRKLRRNGSNVSSSNNENNNTVNKDGSLRARFRLGSTPCVPTKSASIAETSELPKGSVDGEMTGYWELRNQRWKNREEMLITETLI